MTKRTCNVHHSDLTKMGPKQNKEIVRKSIALFLIVKGGVIWDDPYSYRHCPTCTKFCLRYGVLVSDYIIVV